MAWIDNALKLLNDSLTSVPVELNELDWKSGLSNKTDRLAQHLSAFANQKGGGVLVFGVYDNGVCFDLSKQEIDRIIKTLGNIAANNLNYSIPIEHRVEDYKGHHLLFIYVPEQNDKPVYLKGKTMFDSYHRSAGQTIKMSRSQVKLMIAKSEGITFENGIAMSNIESKDLLERLDYKSFFVRLDKDIPKSQDAIIGKLKDFGFCQENGENWDITNLGALLYAKDFNQFSSLKGREIIVRKYVGTNNRDQIFEQHGGHGYAVGFDGLVNFIMKNTGHERIGIAREVVPSYPEVAIREFVANAMVHQDFGITGTPVTIEIFTNRLVITNPGPPLNDINRLIDLPPQSRNEQLAQVMFMLRFCEKRGSGIDRAIEAIEKMFLPAVKFTKSEQHTRVFLFPQKDFSKMSKQEKIAACYQHACLMYEDNNSINNQSVRERFELNKNRSATASRIIGDTLAAGLIKTTDEDMTSKKFASYIPFYG